MARFVLPHRWIKNPDERLDAGFVQDNFEAVEQGLNDVDFGQTVYARAALSGNQSVATSTRTLIQLSVFRFNVGVATISSNRIVIPVGGDGLYSISASVTYAGSVTGTRLVQIVANVSGTDNVLSWDEGGPSPAVANPRSLTPSALHPLSAGDTVGLYGYHENGAPLNVVGGAVITGAFPNYSDLTIARVAKK
jgi:hypothetical protein